MYQLPATFAAMANVSSTKKPASKPLQDWHPADVVAAVHKAGMSLRRLSLRHGYHERSLQVALGRSWPRAERIIASAIGLRPHAIWPTRYDADGAPKSGHGEHGGIGRPKSKDSRSVERAQRDTA